MNRPLGSRAGQWWGDGGGSPPENFRVGGSDWPTGRLWEMTDRPEIFFDWLTRKTGQFDPKSLQIQQFSLNFTIFRSKSALFLRKSAKHGLYMEYLTQITAFQLIFSFVPPPSPHPRPASPPKLPSPHLDPEIQICPPTLTHFDLKPGPVLLKVETKSWNSLLL